MDGFTYTNIFDTKGIEYIVVIAFLLLIIPYWLVLNRKRVVSAPVSEPLSEMFGFAVAPSGFLFSRNHTWIHPEEDGQASLGLDAFIVRAAGRLGLNILKKEGDTVSRGEVVAEAFQGSRKLRICSPVSGEISGINRNLGENSLLKDPYGESWICRVSPANWRTESKLFMPAGEAGMWLKAELGRLKDMLSAFISSEAIGDHSPVLQDGGEIIGHPLSEMPMEAWEVFEKSFLNLETD